MLLKAIYHEITIALQAARAAGELNLEELPQEIKIEVPRDLSHGDYATSLALSLAKPARMAPRKIAEVLVSYLDSPLFESIEIAGPGFINFRLSWPRLREMLKEVRVLDTQFGQHSAVDAHRYLLEFVSANPTGPLHFGHGRWAVLGDCLARLMRLAGYDVSTEFYVNDTGAQINNLGASLQACYFNAISKQGQKLTPESEALLAAYQAEKSEIGKVKVKFYHGDYIQDLADDMLTEFGPDAQDQPQAFFSDFGRSRLLQAHQLQMENFGVHFDEWFSESQLHAEGAIEDCIAQLKAAGVTYESEGALWFRSTDYGDDKDRVLVKSSGSTTYFANDVAYHRNKLNRGYDRIINILGADHHGYIARMSAAVQALGAPKEAFDVLLGQIVNLYRDGQPVRMSKRTGDIITFEEVFEEVGKDATRYLLMQRSADSMIDFDLELAKEQSSKNPVFYVQYAHARIASIFRTAQQSPDLADLESQLDQANLNLLEQPEERLLILKILSYPDELVLAALYREPHRMASFAEELAALFHSFYRQCRVLDENNLPLSQARLALAQAARLTIRNVLNGIFGISVPESMSREVLAESDPV